MRTYAEVVQRVQEPLKGMFDFARDTLIDYLDYADARQFLKAEATREEWLPVVRSLTEDSVREQIVSYLPFAFEKAEDQRGLSAIRSIQRFRAWIWLLGEEYADLLAFLEDEDNFQGYGETLLHRIAEVFQTVPS